MPLSERRRISILLLVVGAILTAASRVKLPAWDAFSDALAGLGFALGFLARSDVLFPERGGPGTGPDAKGPPSSPPTRPPS